MKSLTVDWPCLYSKQLTAKFGGGKRAGMTAFEECRMLRITRDKRRKIYCLIKNNRMEMGESVLRIKQRN